MFHDQWVVSCLKSICQQILLDIDFLCYWCCQPKERKKERKREREKERKKERKKGREREKKTSCFGFSSYAFFCAHIDVDGAAAAAALYWKLV